jgi:hypothetical protein
MQFFIAANSKYNQQNRYAYAWDTDDSFNGPQMDASGTEVIWLISGHAWTDSDGVALTASTDYPSWGRSSDASCGHFTRFCQKISVPTPKQNNKTFFISFNSKIYGRCVLKWPLSLCFSTCRNAKSFQYPGPWGMYKPWVDETWSFKHKRWFKNLHSIMENLLNRSHNKYNQRQNMHEKL